MRGLTLFLCAAALVLAVTNSTLPLLAGWESRNVSQLPTRGRPDGGAWETMPVNEKAERDGLAVRVVSVQRPADPCDTRIVLSIVLENQTPEAWLVMPRAFALQDRTHTITYPAQFPDPQLSIQYLKEDMLGPGKARQGAVLFRAPSAEGLELAVGLYSGRPATYLPLSPGPSVK
jgi:hypothetical protein